MGACGVTVMDVRDDVAAFVNVNVIPMDTERIIRNQTVIVRDGLIAAIGESDAVPVPPRAQRIDGSGRFLLPGLIDAHVHLRSVQELLSYLAHGVTSVVHLSGPTGATGDVLDLRSRVASGETLGPTIYTTGPILDGDPAINPGVSAVVNTPDEAARTVVAQVDAGVDFVKVYNNLPRPALRTAIATAHERKTAVFGHIPRTDGRIDALQAALSAGLDVIAHGEEFFFTFFYDRIEDQLAAGVVPTVAVERLPAAVQLTRQAGVTVIPNLVFISQTRAQLDDLPAVLGHPEARFLTASVMEMWRLQNPTKRNDLERFDRREQAKYPFVRELTRALSDAGVPLLLGTDASAPGLLPGVSAQLELRELVKAGLTPYEAIRAGTSTAGRFIAAHRRETASGIVALGNRADLILLLRNPLDDVANVAAIDGVFIRGKWLTALELAERRERAMVSHPSS